MAEKQQKRKEYMKTYRERNCRKTVALGDDFRQVLRVIRKGSRCGTIDLLIKVFCLFLFQTFKLKYTMQAIIEPDFF